MAFGVFVAITIALTFHEFGHALAAKMNGDLTAKYAGRLTLNPLKHLDSMGTLMMLVVGFGWAKPVPVNPNNFEHQRKGIAMVSLGGVAFNLLLIILGIPLLILTVYFGIVIGTYTNTGYNTVGYVFYWMFFYVFLYQILLNAVLLVFNLLPLPPLDGSHLVEAFTRYDNRWNVFMRKYGRQIFIGLILVGVIVGWFTPLWHGFRFFDIIGNLLTGVQWLMLRMIYAIFGLVFG